MKTIWIINEYAGSKYHGMVYRHYYLARELVKKGHKVYIISSSFSHTFTKPPITKGSFTFENIDEINYIWVKVPKYTRAHSKKRFIKWMIFTLRLFFLRTSKLSRPDVVLVSPTAPFSILAGYYFKKRFKCKLFYEIRDIWPLSIVELGGFSPKHPVIKLMQWCEDFAYRKSDKVISVLPKAIEHAKTRGLLPSKFVYIPNGFSMEEFNNKELLNAKHAEAIPKEKFIVGYAGKLGISNSMSCLLEVALRLKEYADIVFVIVGDGQEKLPLLKFAKVNELKNIIFLDSIFRDSVQSLLDLFDICYIGWNNCSLYRFGISPNKLHDYMYSAKPIIHSVTAGNDPVKDANCGISVEAENPNAIADAILKLYRMPKEERDRLGQNGREYVIKNHEYGKLAEKLISLF